jgi:predicted acyl esterase
MARIDEPTPGPPPPGAEGAVELRPLSAATLAWWGYDRPAEYGSVRTQVQVPMADGTRLDATLVRPAVDGEAAPGPFPGLVVEFTPYHLLRGVFLAEARYFAERGYVAVVANLRGTGQSEGTWQHAMSPQDGRDARDLVEWLAAHPSTDGRIGMFGESYGGQTSYGAAVERAPHLLAIAPMQSPADLYADVIYPGGVKTTEAGVIDVWPGAAQALSGERIDAAAEYAANRAHPTFDAYWQERTLHGRHAAIEVPVFALGGWPDEFFRAGALTNIEGAPERTWAAYGPWPHLPPVAFPGGATAPPHPLPPGVLLAWFDHWVAGRPGVPIPAAPTFVSWEGPDGVGAGWRELSHWAPAGTTAGAVTLHFGPDGTLTERPADAGTVAFDQPRRPVEPGGSATFTTAPLAADRVVLGWSRVALFATLSGADANLHAELLDVAPDGTTTRLNDGSLRASHRRSHVAPTPVSPGEATSFTFDVRPVHHRVAAGHRIGLRLSGGHPRALTPNPEPVEVRITTGDGGSTLTLPGPAVGAGTT